MTFFAILLAFALSIPYPFIFPETSFASVQKQDEIMGQTLESRGLKASLCPSIDASSAYLIDSDGEVYFARNAEEERQIASITKIMTAIVALESASLDSEVTVSSFAARVGESSAGLIAGDKLTLGEALKALMVPSGNDAAIAIAESVGKSVVKTRSEANDPITKGDGSQITGTDDQAAMDAFVFLMNQKAAELGCTNTVYTNPHGLDYDEFAGDLHSCAKEVSIIAAYAMQNDFFREIVDIPSADISVDRSGTNITINLKSTDELLGVYEGACGIKTGMTKLAGPCFAGACERDGQTLYAIILNSTSEEQRFIDCTTLYNWVFDNTIDYMLAHSSETTQMHIDGEEREVPVVAEVALSSWIDKTVPATFEDPQQTVKVFRLKGNISQEFVFDDVSGGVSAGQVIGHVNFYQDNALIATENMVSTQSIDAPDFFESIGIFFQKIFNSLAGTPTAAESVAVNDVELLIDKG